jgi:hypothetical protein
VVVLRSIFCRDPSIMRMQEGDILILLRWLGLRYWEKFEWIDRRVSVLMNDIQISYSNIVQHIWHPYCHNKRMATLPIEYPASTIVLK